MYLLHGSLKAKNGHANELADVLVQASQLVSNFNGCKLYVVSKDAGDQNSLYVTEIWESKEDHDSSLKNSEVRELIARALPILDNQPSKGQELEILGGI